MVKPTETKFSRRSFLQKIGVGTAAATVLGMMPAEALIAQASEEGMDDGPAILIDLTRCVGCNSCVLACKGKNDLPRGDKLPTELSSDTLTFIDERQVTNAKGEEITHYVKRQCMHCLDASCVSACPAGAMHKDETGAVVYSANLCLGCRYCEVACPFGIPRFEWDNGLDPVISKCWLCYDRLKEGQKPACVAACPTGALRFGTRSNLLAQAHAEIASNPGRYIDHVFGEFEVGGTSMLYISDTPFDDLGFPVNLPDTAPPQETEKIMTKLPAVIGGMTALMAGSAIYTHRSSDVEVIEQQAGETLAPSPEKEGDE